MMGKFSQVPKGGLTPDDLVVKDKNGRTVVEVAIEHASVGELSALLTPAVLRTQILEKTKTEGPVFVHLGRIGQLTGLPGLVPGDLRAECARGNALNALAEFGAVGQLPKALLFSAEGVQALKAQFGLQQTCAAHTLASKGNLDHLPAELPGDFMLVQDEGGFTPYHHAFTGSVLGAVPLHLRRLNYLAVENKYKASVLDMVLEKGEREGSDCLGAILPESAAVTAVAKFWEVQSAEEREGWGKLAEHINEIDRWLKATELVRSDVGISPASGGEFDPFAL
jgi:hypothetical protein